ncbi:MAG: hypothetical protein ACQESH_00725 [Campylobacterota bacterium]
MKMMLEYFMHKKILFKQFETIDVRSLNSKKKVKIYLGVDQKSYYNVIIAVTKKSRILQKEAIQLNELVNTLENIKGITIKKKHLYLDAPICSKATVKLQQLNWKIHDIG